MTFWINLIHRMLRHFRVSVEPVVNTCCGSDMLRFRRVFWVLAGLVCLSCAPQDVVVPAEDSPRIPVRKAYFATNPLVLHEVFRVGCDGPGDTYDEPNWRTARCAILPTPEGAAFLLIEFDAELEIPRLVVQKVTRRSGEGYEVEMSYFAEIRSKDGVRQRVYMPRETLDRQIDMILENTGGTPVEG